MLRVLKRISGEGLLPDHHALQWLRTRLEQVERSQDEPVASDPAVPGEFVPSVIMQSFRYPFLFGGLCQWYCVR